MRFQKKTRSSVDASLFYGPTYNAVVSVETSHDVVPHVGFTQSCAR